jgi:hypothetical protein
LKSASLPPESFAELAFELRLIARDKAHAAESASVLVAQIETLGEIDQHGGIVSAKSRRPLELPGMRDAVAALEHRARLAGVAADLLDKFAAHEPAVRTLITTFNSQGEDMGTKLKPGKFDCYANAKLDEPLFILLARDRSARFVVRFWALCRAVMILVRLKPRTDWAMVREAWTCARDMGAYQKPQAREAA